jgi:hypothetical protein
VDVTNVEPVQLNRAASGVLYTHLPNQQVTAHVGERREFV